MTLNKFRAYVFICFGVLLIGAEKLAAKEFKHPGMLNSEADFERMRAQIDLKVEPWKSGWDALEGNWHSWSTYGVRGPVETIIRGGSGQNFMLLAHDASAAYANALHWKISGSEDHAKKAIEILNGYANVLKTIGGSTDAMLAMGFQGYQLANAAEIMRTYGGWSAEELHKFQQFMIEVFYGLESNPHYNGIRRFLAAHNGTQDGYYWANWDLAAMTTMLSIGILADDTVIYNKAINYFKEGSGNGNIAKLVNHIHDGTLGQWQESGRDQGHTAMGPPLMAIFCEMAWKQGEDLYGFDDNRLLKGSEYVAKYNLGNAIPFATYYHPKNFGGYDIQDAVSPAGRGNIRTGWELLYNHYVIRKGLQAPFTQISAYKRRPEGGPSNGNSGDFDLIGYSTLTATRTKGHQRKAQEIVWADTTMILRGPDLELGAIASSGLRPYYTLSDFSMGEIVNNKFRAYKAGSISITAWQPGDHEYDEALPVTRQIDIVDQGVSVAPDLDQHKVELVLSSTDRCTSVSGGSTEEGGGIIQWRCYSGEEQKWILEAKDSLFYIVNQKSGMALTVKDNATTSGAIVEQRHKSNGLFQLWKIAINLDGTYKIFNHENGLQLGALGSNTNEGAVFAVETPNDNSSHTFKIRIELKRQFISFLPLENAHPNDSGITLNASAESGLPITYSTTNPAIATVRQDTLLIHKVGMVGIIASQAGNDEYDAAYDALQWLRVTRREQICEIPDHSGLKLGDSDFALNAVCHSGLPFVIKSSDSSIAIYNNESEMVKILNSGSVTLTLNQLGNEEYMPAVEERTLSFAEAEQSSGLSFEKKDLDKIEFFDHQIIIPLSLEQNFKIKIFDLSGKEWLVPKASTGLHTTLDLQSLPLGSYLVILDAKSQQYTFRIMKNE